MTKCPERLLFAAVMTGCLITAPALHAQTGNAYLGAGAGIADFEDQVTISDVGEADFDDDSTAYKFYGGYRATRNLAIEGGYRDFGEGEAGPFTIETTGVGIAALGLIPVGPFDFYARGGIIFWDSDGTGGVPGDSGQDPMYGLGGQIHFGNLFVRLESEWFEIDLPEDTQMVSASVGWTFP